MTREQWSVTTMECDEQWSERERVLTVRGKSGASVGKVERRVPQYTSCATSVGTAAIGDEIRRNRSNGAITRLCSWDLGKDRGQRK